MARPLMMDDGRQTHESEIVIRLRGTEFRQPNQHVMSLVALPEARAHSPMVSRGRAQANLSQQTK